MCLTVFRNICSSSWVSLMFPKFPKVSQIRYYCSFELRNALIKTRNYTQQNRKLQSEIWSFSSIHMVKWRSCHLYFNPRTTYFRGEIVTLQQCIKRTAETSGKAAKKRISRRSQHSLSYSRKPCETTLINYVTKNSKSLSFENY